jgi:hypothetical protein
MMLFTLLFALVAIAGFSYGWYQHIHALSQAREETAQELHDAHVAHGLSELHCRDLKHDLERANKRIELLNAKLLAGRPVGSIMKRNAQVLKQQEHARETDPTATAELPHKRSDDLSSIQLL